MSGHGTKRPLHFFERPSLTQALTIDKHVLDLTRKDWLTKEENAFFSSVDLNVLARESVMVVE